MTLVIVGCVCWGVLAVVRAGGTDEPERPETEGVQGHHVPAGLPIPDGPPHVIGFVLGLFVFFVGWALWR
jgi:hypothetical protein